MVLQSFLDRTNTGHLLPDADTCRLNEAQLPCNEHAQEKDDGQCDADCQSTRHVFAA